MTRWASSFILNLIFMGGSINGKFLRKLLSGAFTISEIWGDQRSKLKIFNSILIQCSLFLYNVDYEISCLHFLNMVSEIKRVKVIQKSLWVYGSCHIRVTYMYEVSKGAILKIFYFRAWFIICSLFFFSLNFLWKSFFHFSSRFCLMMTFVRL